MERLHKLLATPDDPYAGGDLAKARRIGAVIWLITVAFALLLLCVYQPTAVGGPAGWALFLVGTLGGLPFARRLADLDTEVTWDQLLWMGYIGVAQVAFAHWITGGAESAYAELYLLIAVYVGMIHPPRRVLGVLAAIAVASALPLAYHGWDAGLAAQ